MKKIAFFDAKPYDITSFRRYENEEIKFRFYENKLNPDTMSIAAQYDGVCAFVNDTLNRDVINYLGENGVGVIALRCAGYNNVDLKAAQGKVKIYRVPAYSPHAIAEHTMGMILMLNRKLHRAYIRTRDHNFSLEGLTGFDLYGKTVGIIGTGKIGCCFADVCKGFGMKVFGFDPYKNSNFCGEYCNLDELLSSSDIISLHCPLTKENKHIINSDTISKMRDGVYIINTSRGKLVDTAALIEGIKEGKVGACGLDVYEEETAFFFEDKSDEIILDDNLLRLIAMPNVLVTSHQAFLTKEALDTIAQVTVQNFADYFNSCESKNEVVAK
ncbi:MAG: 2-hydroxyacid dehydrogenase [Clostridia bacterium]|nr:2-hydroxyacid dehydrogenase [Clostridia bacterium]